MNELFEAKDNRETYCIVFQTGPRTGSTGHGSVRDNLVTELAKMGGGNKTKNRFWPGQADGLMSHLRDLYLSHHMRRAAENDWRYNNARKPNEEMR